jgi:hypothetical protein
MDGIFHTPRVALEVVPCKLSHIRAIIPRLRWEERFSLEQVDLKARHAMIGLWRETDSPRAAIAGGNVVAVWGDCSPPLAAEGSLWLFTSELIEAIPVTLVKMAKAEIARMLEFRQVLRSSIHKSCARELRFYDMLGFEFIEGTMREGFVEIRVSRS